VSRFLVVGGAHVDRRGTITGTAIGHASNPGTWRIDAGGGAFNAACNLARLGHDVRLIAPRGGDAEADIVARAADAAGLIDTPITYLDRATPTYTAILDARGDLVVALADMALYDIFGPRQFARRSIRAAVADADAILTDANLPAATVEALAARCTGSAKPLAAIAISPAKVGRLRGVLDSLEILFMNEREAAALCGGDAGSAGAWPPLLRRLGLRAGVVTRGPAPAIGFDQSGAFEIATTPVDGIADVTGAGDACAAATYAALVCGTPLPDAMRVGAAAASFALRSRNAVASDLDADRLRSALTLVPPAKPLQEEA
jgi:pseudouridine kinase